MKEKNLWKEKYINNRFLPNKDESKTIITKEELVSQCPGSLFKYRYISKNDEYTIKNLKEDKIIFRNPNFFNDPYDSAISIDLHDYFIQRAQKYEVYQADRKFFNDMVKKFSVDKLTESFQGLMDKKIEEEINNLRICCFSESNDSILMWSHYANEHMGFCVKYDFFELQEKYTEIYPVVYKKDLENFNNRFFSNNYENDMFKVPIITKYSDWEYEDEWRVIIEKNINHNFFEEISDTEQLVYTPVPKAIYLGCKISDEHKEIIKDVCKEKKIDLYGMKMKKNKFKLEPYKIEL